MSEDFQMNTPQKEILCIKPDGSFRVGDGVDPMFALGELANAYMKQRDRIKLLEDAGDAMVETTTTPAAEAWRKARGEAKP